MNCFEVLEDERKNTWEALREAMVESANNTLPKKEKESNVKWITQEILDLMRKRQKFKSNCLKYKEIDKEINVKCVAAKEKCLEIENLQFCDCNQMHKKIQHLTGKKMCSSSGCIKAKDGTILMEKEEIVDRWCSDIQMFRYYSMMIEE